MDKENNTIEVIEKQINARYVLMRSANLAVQNGYLMRTWVSDEGVKKLVRDSGLDEDIIMHIAVFIWNPMK